MIDDDLKFELLTSISLEGATLEENKSSRVIIANQKHARENILSFSSGMPKIKNPSTFKLALKSPLFGINPLNIRCCLCNKTIAYPAWHKIMRFTVNQFHYFVCFDNTETRQVTAKCFKI